MLNKLLITFVIILNNFFLLYAYSDDQINFDVSQIEILEGGNLLRVSYGSFANREDAVLALNQIKQENSDAWLLTK